MQLENHVSEKICARLKEVGVYPANLIERVHLAMNLVQSFSHEYVFDNHDYIDYSAMHEIVCNTIINLFEI